MYLTNKQSEDALIEVLQSRKIKKIYLVGSVGSGKTTLGKVLATKLSLNFYEMDNIIFERLPPGDRKRSDEEVNNLVGHILEEDTWLIEGTCLRDIVQPIFNNSQIIIFLDIPYLVRVFRFSKRFLKQLLHIEEANYKPSLKMYFNMFKWNHSFEKQAIIRLLRELKTIQKKDYIIRKNKELGQIKSQFLIFFTFSELLNTLS
ncbi:shikimate kinase [Vagococcus fluvialis]|uniref:shikimate kinase n=1 Tax=Vagococcus fluvialis TaxID=2738 RepID=UPI001A8CFAA0|nr:shikimate kinase [Vagococcus fluvialis]MBO0438267.1 AAA family ATPase [Vagococcus fluvialis]